MNHPRSRPPFAQRLVAAIEGSDVIAKASRLLDQVTGNLQPGPGSPLRDDRLGHSWHPTLTDLPLGSWTSASLLDLLGGKESRRDATVLVGIGLVSAVPTALTGFADWTALDERERRIGLVHALGNDVALVLFTRSLLARTRGDYGRGARLALLGNAFTATAGYLGGYLALNRATASRAGDR